VIKRLTFVLGVILPWVGLAAYENQGYLDSGGGNVLQVGQQTHFSIGGLFVGSSTSPDGRRSSAPDPTQGDEQTPNAAPMIVSLEGNASSTVEVLENQVSVTDVDAIDANGDALSYSIFGGADQAKFNLNTTTGVLTFKLAPSYQNPTDTNSDNTYEVTVRVSDGVLYDEQNLSVVVRDSTTNLAPVIVSNGGSVSVSLNRLENNTTVDTVAATDGNGDTVLYSISGGADQAKFSIGSSSGSLVFLSAPDFENPTDQGTDNTYEVTVRASDGTLFDEQSISVIIAKQGQAPTVTSNGGGDLANLSIPENQTSVTTLTAVHPDGTKTITFSKVGGPDQMFFEINSTTGVLAFVTPPDHENPRDFGSNNTYEVIVRASDGVLHDDQTIIVSILNLNEFAPVISIGLGVWENQLEVSDFNATDGDGDVVSYSIVGGADQSKFELKVGSATLVFKTAPDYEVPTDAGSNNVYEVVIRATDGFLHHEKILFIKVWNVFEDLDGDGTEDHNDTDQDGDGLSDEKEKELGTDPRNSDTDGEGLSDGNESKWGTDPKNPDTDGDGFTDKEEVDAGSDPLKSYSNPNAPTPSGSTFKGMTADYELITLLVTLTEAKEIAASKGGTVLDFSLINDRTALNGFLLSNSVQSVLNGRKTLWSGERGKVFAPENNSLSSASVLEKLNFMIVYGTPFNARTPVIQSAKHLHMNWFESAWFGIFWQSSSSWIKHKDMGWLYLGGNPSEGIWFWWHPDRGWQWTSSAVFPFMWSHYEQDWLYLNKQTGSVPLIYSYGQKKYYSK